MAVPLFNLAPDLIVSRLCLGTMTFGEQNSLPESFLLLDKAFDSGINFFDSAEISTSVSSEKPLLDKIRYPVPQRAVTQGRSEEYVGRWMRERKVPRDRVMLATKAVGDSLELVLSIPSLVTLFKEFVCSVCELITLTFIKFIGLIGLYVPMFGETEYDPIKQFDSIDIEEQLDGLGRAVDAGKIRYIGLSNETPYGIMKFLHIAGRGPGRPKIVSVQAYLDIAGKYGLHPVSLAVGLAGVTNSIHSYDVLTRKWTRHVFCCLDY
ncbi:hypothetical protein RHGRI_035683 [Rhododendron griersonianum]|uniref:NADP-dependent oxidoreductase domain-containing protein n=1 Tax=Rhododendron griersonianum TaxID=479676 RepID=A0AAV6HP64_9ERIC|nr:hypothetical protein RHGRI_035683 [Rhododendron griersonianum]